MLCHDCEDCSNIFNGYPLREEIGGKGMSESMRVIGITFASLHMRLIVRRQKSAVVCMTVDSPHTKKYPPCGK